MSGKGTWQMYPDQTRRDRLLKELDHDPYHSKVKHKEPTVCPECKAVFHKGRWVWGEMPAGAHGALCPACQRIRDDLPAAYLTLRGAFLGGHLDEIMNLIHNYEARERAAHPLKRVMAIEEFEDGITVSFTEAHLARGIGEALHDAYEGELSYQYADEDIMLRVLWCRDA